MKRNMFLKSMVAGAFAIVLQMPSEEAWAEPRVDVRVENVQPGAGPVRVALFDEANWLSETVIDGASVEAQGVVVAVRLEAPRPGRYAISVFQDINRDGRLNRNLVGMPTEPWGASNDAPGNFGPPRFADAVVAISANGGRTTLRLR